MCGLEVYDGLYEAVAHVRAEQAHAMGPKHVNIQHHRLDYASERVVQAS